MTAAPAPLRASVWLSFAAAPTFALMALFTALSGGAHAAALCTQATEPWDLSGMAPMYLLMAAFHLAPWLRRTART